MFVIKDFYNFIVKGLNILRIIVIVICLNNKKGFALGYNAVNCSHVLTVARKLEGF